MRVATGKRLKLRHYDISRAHFKEQPRDTFTFVFQRKIKIHLGDDKNELVGQERVRPSAFICGDSGGCRRGKHSAALFHTSRMDVRMAARGANFACVADEDGSKHFHGLLDSTYTAKNRGALGFDTGDSASLRLLNQHVHQGRFFGIAPDMRLVPIIIKEAGCDSAAKSVCTLGEKLQDRVVLD